MSQIDALKENNNSLQDSIKQINESNKVTVDGLNNSLKVAKEAMSEKETQITRLRRINEIVYENGSNIHIQDDDVLEYKSLVKRILNNSKLEKELLSNVLKISDTLSTKDFITIEKIKVNTKNEILVGDLDDFQALDNLYIKSVVARIISHNKVTYLFTEAGDIIYNMFLTKVKVSQQKL
ncbi:hypothetical protein ACHRV6_07505 [Flavobacterium sp. FlaQc-51]|uniref:hypothetical protein n=1 Tax=unclassified Flavobacterium TaxID=196869 RepID=UPI00103D1271|nr:hypothetical protein [Flavobacterium sp. Leaf82]